MPTKSSKKKKVHINTYTNGRLTKVEVVYRNLYIWQNHAPTMNWQGGRIRVQQNTAGEYYLDIHVKSVTDKTDQLLAALRSDA